MENEQSGVIITQMLDACIEKKKQKKTTTTSAFSLVITRRAIFIYIILLVTLVTEGQTKTQIYAITLLYISPR